MDLDPLDRPQSNYVSVMEQWLKTPGLTDPEFSIVRTLRDAAGASLEDFNVARMVALSPHFQPLIKSAAHKAQSNGFPMSWNDADLS